MKKTAALFLSIPLLLSAAGCQNAKTRVAEGAGIGALLGAAVGGIVGNQSHHAGEGVAIGLAAGALTGAVVGSQIEKQPAAAAPQGQAASAQPQTQNQAPVFNPNQITVQQVIDFTKQGVNEDVIIDKIRLTNSKFNLSEADLAQLKQANVSQKVILLMQGLTQ